MSQSPLISTALSTKLCTAVSGFGKSKKNGYINVLFLCHCPWLFSVPVILQWKKMMDHFGINDIGRGLVVCLSSKYLARNHEGQTNYEKDYIGDTILYLVLLQFKIHHFPFSGFDQLLQAITQLSRFSVQSQYYIQVLHHKVSFLKCIFLYLISSQSNKAFGSTLSLI